MSTVVGGGVLATTSCAADVAEDTDGSSRGLRAIRSSLSSSAFLFAGALQDVLVMLTMSPPEEGVEGATNFVGGVGAADGRCLFSLVSSPLAVCKGNGETVWTAAASVASEGLASWSRFLLLPGGSTDGSLFSCVAGNAEEAIVGATVLPEGTEAILGGRVSPEAPVFAYAKKARHVTYMSLVEGSSARTSSRFRRVQTASCKSSSKKSRKRVCWECNASRVSVGKVGTTCGSAKIVAERWRQNK